MALESAKRGIWSCVAIVFMVMTLSLGCRKSSDKPKPQPRVAHDDLGSLATSLQSTNERVQAGAIVRLPAHGEAALPILAKALPTLSPALQMGVILSMQKIGVPAIPFLLDILTHKRSALRGQAASAIASLYPQFATTSPQYETLTRRLIKALAQAKDALVWKQLHKALCHSKAATTYWLIQALRAYGTLNARRKKAGPLAALGLGDLPPPSSRLIGVLRCRGPLADKALKQLMPLPPKVPRNIAAQLMGLFTSSKAHQHKLLDRAWVQWLKHANVAFVVLVLDQMWSLTQRSVPSAGLQEQMRLLLTRGQPAQQWRAARLLGRWGQLTGKQHSLLMNALKAKAPRLRHAAAVALARQRLPLATLLQRLAEGLRDPDATARSGAVRALGEAASYRNKVAAKDGEGEQIGQIIKRLKQALHTKQPTIREAAVAALGRWAYVGNQPAAGFLLVALVDKKADVREAAVRALGKLKQQTANIRVAVLGLTQALRDGSAHIRKLAALGLGRMGLQGAPALQALSTAQSTERDYLAKQTMLQASKKIIRAVSQHAPGKR